MCIFLGGTEQSLTFTILILRGPRSPSSYEAGGEENGKKKCRVIFLSSEQSDIDILFYFFGIYDASTTGSGLSSFFVVEGNLRLELLDLLEDFLLVLLILLHCLLPGSSRDRSVIEAVLQVLSIRREEII